ncbi:MAG: GFA family protein [Pseudomonadota bacterium]
MSDAITGGCLCGAVRYSLAKPPKMQVACHCDDCKKQTSSAFSLGAVTPHEDIAIDGALTEFEVAAESGRPVKRHFCGACGTTIYLDLEPRPDAKILQAGTLDDASWFRPSINFYTECALDFVAVDESAKNFPRYF